MPLIEATTFYLRFTRAEPHFAWNKIKCILFCWTLCITFSNIDLFYNWNTSDNICRNDKTEGWDSLAVNWLDNNCCTTDIFIFQHIFSCDEQLKKWQSHSVPTSVRPSPFCTFSLNLVKKKVWSKCKLPELNYEPTNDPWPLPHDP